MKAEDAKQRKERAVMIFLIFQTTLPLVARSGFAGTGSLREQDFFDFFLLVGAELHPVAAGIKRSVVFYEPQVGTKTQNS